MFLKAKNWFTRATWHEEDNGEVLGPLRGGQGQVGDVGKSPGIHAAPSVQQLGVAAAAARGRAKVSEFRHAEIGAGKYRDRRRRKK